MVIRNNFNYRFFLCKSQCLFKKRQNKFVFAKKYHTFAKLLRKGGNSSVGRAQPCQGWGRGSESRFPLENFKVRNNAPKWRNW